MNNFTFIRHFFGVLISLVFIQVGFSQSTPCTAYRYNNAGYTNCTGVIQCDIPTQSSITTFSSNATGAGDTDGDGVFDSVDNCPFNLNSNQMDSDNDGVGNACQNPFSSIPCGLESISEEHVVWVQFDLQTCGTNFIVNLYETSGKDLGWVLYNSNVSTDPNDLIDPTRPFLGNTCGTMQGDCTDLSYTNYCGVDGNQTHIIAPGTNSGSYTNYYMAVFATDPTSTPDINFNIVIQSACSSGDNLDVTCPSPSTIDLECLTDMPNASLSITSFNALDVYARINDYCTNVQITSQDFDLGGTGCFGDPRVIRREYLIEDANDQETCTLYYQIEAPSLPQITCGPYEGNYVTCPDDIHPSADDVIWTGGCPDGATVTISEPDIMEVGGPTCDLTCFHYTYTITDECGATATCGKTWVIFEGGPQFDSCIDPLELQCGDPMIDEKQLIKDWLNTAESIGGCGESVEIENDYDRLVYRDTCGLGRIHDITFIAEDDCGRKDTCYSTIYILDSKEPNIATKPRDQTANCSDDVDAIWNEWVSTNGTKGLAIDCCSEVYWTYEPDTYNMPCDGASGVTEVTFYAWDDCGLYDSETATFTIDGIATDALVLTEAAMDMTVEAGPDAEDALNDWLTSHAGATATGGCGNSWSSNYTGLDLMCGDYTGTAEVIFTVTSCDESFETTATFIIEDTTPPVITETTSIDEVDVTDSADPNPTISYDDADVGCGTIRTWTATDACGNSSTLDVQITMGDMTPPTFTSVPGNTTIDCSMTPAFGTPIATDTESTVTLTHEDVDTGIACNRIITRTWTATDACGNTATASQTISFTDTEEPTFTYLPIDLTLECDVDLTIPMATAADNCGTVTVTFTEWLNDGAITDNCNNDFGYDIYREWTATDECGNTTKTTTVAWAVPAGYKGPVFVNMPGNREIGCNEDPQFDEVNCTTACGELTLVFEDTAVLDDCNGKSFTRTWTAIDDCGKVTIESQTLSVPADNEAPEITFTPENIEVNCGQEIPSFGTPQCQDNCTAEINHFDVNFEDVKIDGCTTERTWFITDACGNMATTAQQIKVMDNEVPYFDAQLADKVGTCNDNLAFDAPMANDACSEVSLLFEDKVIENECGMTTTRTWIATDACGNENSITQSIKLEDTASPSFEMELNSKAVSCGEEIVFDTPNATDDCSEVSLTSNDNEVQDGCKTIYTRTWTATDICGNAKEISQEITLQDIEAPYLSNEIENKIASCGDEVTFDTPVAADNCSEVAMTVSDDTIIEDCKTIETRTWNFTDACGNLSIFAQSITFEDNAAPMYVEAPQSLEMTIEEYKYYITPTINSEDNCSDVTISEPVITSPTTCEDDGYSYMWTATDACGNVNTHTMMITISDLNPILELETPASVDCGEQITLDLGIAGGIDPISLEWTIEGADGWEILDVDNQKIIVNSANGDATIEVTATTSTGCITTKSVDLTCKTTANVEIFDSISQFEVAPNPATEHLVLTINNQSLKSAEIIVMNIIGKTKMNKNIDLHAGINDIDLDIKDLVAGTYLIGIKSQDGKQYFTKFIKVRP